MYYGNLFGNGQSNQSALTSPPNNTLAALLAQQQAMRARQPMGGPQIPQMGQNQMGGAAAPSLGPGPAVGGAGTMATPQTGGMMNQLAGMDPARLRALLQSLGLGNLANGGAGAAGASGAAGGAAGASGPLMGDIGQWLGLGGMFGGR